MTNTTKKTRYVKVYRMDYAMKLIDLGHNVIATMPNTEKPELIMWIFESTEDFERDLTNLVREGRRNE